MTILFKKRYDLTYHMQIIYPFIYLLPFELFLIQCHYFYSKRIIWPATILVFELLLNYHNSVSLFFLMMISLQVAHEINGEKLADGVASASDAIKSFFTGANSDNLAIITLAGKLVLYSLTNGLAADRIKVGIDQRFYLFQVLLMHRKYAYMWIMYLLHNWLLSFEQLEKIKYLDAKDLQSEHLDNIPKSHFKINLMKQNPSASTLHFNRQLTVFKSMKKFSIIVAFYMPKYGFYCLNWHFV